MQLELFSMPRTRREVNTLFFALFPDRDTALKLAAAGRLLDRKFRLRAKPRPLEHLHVTVFAVESKVEVPELFVKEARRAADALAHHFPAFELIFNQALVYPESGALVLEADCSSRIYVQTLCGQLDAFLKRRSVSLQKVPSFKPHVTLAYGKRDLPAIQHVPIACAFGEIQLIMSEVGKTNYHRLGKWKLGGSRAG